MKRLIILFALLLPLITAVNSSAEIEKITKEARYTAGIRMGGWANQGELPVKLDFNPLDSSDWVETDVTDGSFYIEAFFGYRLKKNLEVEMSLGLTNRGDVTITLNNRSDFGQIMIYPMLVQLKLYPLGGSDTKFQPYFGGGGGLYYGRRTIQFTQNYYYYSFQYEGQTETEFNIVGTAGFEWKVAGSTSLDFNMKYMPVNFSDYLVGINDYSAFTITVGVKFFRK